MRFPKNQEVDSAEMLKFLAGEVYGLLICYDGRGLVRSGVQNYFLMDGEIYIHLGVTDEQAIILQHQVECTFVVERSFSVIPSFWVDPDYGGAANMCFKYLEIESRACLITDQIEKNKLFNIMMSHYMPPGSYAPVEERKDLYDYKIKQLLIVKVTLDRVRAKWNFLQGKTPAQRQNVCVQLRQRAKDKDLLTAAEIERWEKH